ncbi:uncharacterized protein PRCAT00004553001 [Priceomyces carsonii]|uniref:uncharacterized protein n=1 Tax=Priceomyces carsonii TaxID=28549 RepID=UPI002EDB80A7|nr:unnamed protein product [Priceomyces carsonii]
MSRLDRLVVLLETGSTPFIRNTAADQLSDLAKGHPEDTINLLGRIYPYLKSNKWETRIAAARAFGGIVNHSEVWDPNSEDTIKKEDLRDSIIKKDEEVKIKIEQDEELKKLDDSHSYFLNFDSFDLHEVLKSSTKLLAAGDDTIVDYDENSMIGKIKKQKQFKPEEPLDEETPEPMKGETPDVKQELPVNDITTTTGPPEVARATSSARLKAMQKRRAKVSARAGANRIAPVDLSQSSISRKLVENGKGNDIKEEGPQYDITSQQGNRKLVVETKAPELSPLLLQHAKVSGLVWEFQGVFELLLSDLFDEKWEIRHGSALGLRELMKKHGKGAGRVRNKSREENDKNNMNTLEDLAVRICALFALDRFGDYVSDTVVVPVRESAAQTLAALLIHLEDNVVLKTFDCLYNLVMQKDEVVKQWEAKHGGMLGVRYFVGVRTDILLKNPGLFDKVVDMVLHGLKESDDDVQSVAALTLSPIVSQFIETKNELIHTLLSVIWDCLTNLRDDLSASIGSVMDLLAKLCTHQEVILVMQKVAEDDRTNSFEELVPRLYPFLRHSITNVRKSVLKTILEFLYLKDNKEWINSKALRLIFQNLLVEQNKDVLNLSLKVYFKLIEEINSNNDLTNLDEIFNEHFEALLSLLMTPIGLARHNYQMNTNLIMRPSGQSLGAINDDKRGRKRKSISEPDIPHDDLKINIDAPIFNGDVMLVGYDTFINNRTFASIAFGKTISFLTDDDLLSNIFNLILKNLKSLHFTARLFSSMIIEEYSNSLRERSLPIPESAVNCFSGALMELLLQHDECVYYRELVPIVKSVRTTCLQFFEVFVSEGKLPINKVPQLPVVVRGDSEAGPGAFGLENANQIVTETYQKLSKSLTSVYRLSAHSALEDAKHRVTVAIDEAKAALLSRSISVLAGFSAAILSLVGIPKKLNPVIRSLMDSIKQEEIDLLQKRAAKSMVHLIQELSSAGKQGALDKIVKNLCAFLCVDTSEVPEFRHNIKFKDNILSLRKEEAKSDPSDIAAHEKAVHQARLKRNGAASALLELLRVYKGDLFEKIPKLKDIMLEPLKQLNNIDENDEAKGQSVIDALGVLRSLLPELDDSHYPTIVDQFPLLHWGFVSEFSVFRYATAKCFATICSVIPSKGFVYLIKSVLPLLNNAGEVRERQGAIETIYHICSTMGSDILPYIVFLIVPVLGRMSDSDPDVRIIATTTFASIIKLVPLEAGISDPEDMPKEILGDRDREREFIQQMMDPTKIKPFALPVSIKATLRKYQQEGVNWLAFLNKYHLHGILCDDMGLGKTLQTICIVSSDHYIRSEKFKETNSVEFTRLPSLVICPPSLTGHWEQELDQYAPFMKVVVYAGGPSARSFLRPQIKDADVVVTSYDVSRNDVEILSSYDFNYCILDEGHIIKNAASKLTKSVKRIKSKHRLILSGTPIQNNVLELWSLFDFLMPGFLGTERVFQDKFAKPIAASRNSKTSSKEQEAGALALESLHKQVLPFMLRRLKEDVLSDLPPKIIQDYYCQLSDLQLQLYKDFANKQKSTVLEEVKNSEGKKHVFQALQYMRKLCNHPALVVSPNHPGFAKVSKFLQSRNLGLKDIENAPKLQSLRTLLLECGIGVDDSDYSSKRKQSFSPESVISDHRALIFCQLKDMLDIVENDLLKRYLPSVTYMRLDGSTDPRERQNIVRKFNEDPSIDVLLLTTKVGGLGLNLTGADTVIFVEHDWNPMNDLQAMDRAHRLGQKKVVNVYRLITKDTLEEKIMGLQKFKMNIASTIVNQQNAGLSSMDTNQLLDLFDVNDTATAATNTTKEEEKENQPNNNQVPGDVTGGLTGKAAGAVGELADLWDESQYEDEYNLDAFIKTLK